MPPDRKIGPAGERGTDSETSTAIKIESSLAPSAPEASARRRWAYSLIRRASSPVPSYRSAEWANLPDGDPAKVAGCVVAAEAWAQDAENVVEDLRHEIDVRREVFKLAEDADYQDRAQAHRAEWSRLPSSGKSFAERRAEQLASVKPRPGDYTGRGSA